MKSLSMKDNNCGPVTASPQYVVDRALELACISSKDTVYDLGCNDGRVVIAAAQRYKCKAVGVDISEEVIKKA